MQVKETYKFRNVREQNNKKIKKSCVAVIAHMNNFCKQLVLNIIFGGKKNNKTDIIYCWIYCSFFIRVQRR